MHFERAVSARFQRGFSAVSVGFQQKNELKMKPNPKKKNRKKCNEKGGNIVSYFAILGLFLNIALLHGQECCQMALLAAGMVWHCYPVEH